MNEKVKMVLETLSKLKNLTLEINSEFKILKSQSLLSSVEIKMLETSKDFFDYCNTIDKEIEKLNTLLKNQ